MIITLSFNPPGSFIILLIKSVFHIWKRNHQPRSVTFQNLNHFKLINLTRIEKTFADQAKIELLISTLLAGEISRFLFLEQKWKYLGLTRLSNQYNIILSVILALPN
jgi:hypothetical protein